MFERYAYRYSQWDDSQQIDPFSADDLMDAMADRLIEDGDLRRALRDLYRHGDRGALDNRLTGLRELMERLRRSRQDLLERHDLNGIMDDINERLDDVVQTERTGIDRRLQEAQEPPPSEAEQTSAADNEALRDMLQGMADRKREQLDTLPEDVPGRLKGLSEYDFMDAEARQKFQDLLNMLQQQVMQSYFQGMQQALQNMTPEDLARTREMVRDLNQMLEDRLQGREPKFNEFMDKYGDMFPGVKDLDELLEQLAQRMQAMSSLMQSMSPEMREQLQGMMESLIGDDRLRADLMRLGANLAQLLPMPETEGQRYPFSGDQPLTLMEAMAMMERLQGMSELEAQMQAAALSGQGIDEIDPDKARELMDAESAAQLERLQELTKLLEDAGYIQRRGDKWELTPQAMRKIGQKVLRDVFSNLKRDGIGKHETEQRGAGGERIDESKPYEFGDPFLLDIKGTMMNALARNGAGTPVQMVPDDFEVYRTELLTQSSTVLMLDRSYSMFQDGYFTEAKKVAMALDALIRGQYPRDNLYLVEFFLWANQIQVTDLPLVTGEQGVQGTNFQHGLMLARRLLARSKARNKQIIIVTDGAPTAFMDGGEPRFAMYDRRCTDEALREVMRATREDIVINTFMLETSSTLTGFVESMTAINRGRSFTIDPYHLGEYILVDYVRNKRRKVS